MLRTLLPFIAILPALAYTMISLVCARRFFSAPKTDAITFPAITILKPVKGMEAESYSNFASFCQQDYPGETQMLFGIASPDDPIIPVIRPRDDLLNLCPIRHQHPSREILKQIQLAVGRVGNCLPIQSQSPPCLLKS